MEWTWQQAGDVVVGKIGDNMVLMVDNLVVGNLGLLVGNLVGNLVLRVAVNLALLLVGNLVIRVAVCCQKTQAISLCEAFLVGRIRSEPFVAEPFAARSSSAGMSSELLGLCGSCCSELRLMGRGCCSELLGRMQELRSCGSTSHWSLDVAG